MVPRWEIGCQHDFLTRRTIGWTSPHQQPPESQQDQPRLAHTDAPHQFPCFVAGIFAQRLLDRIVGQIHQAAVVGLLKFMNRAAEQQVNVEFPTQSAQLGACVSSEDL